MEERKAADAQLEILNDVQEKFSDAFKALSAEALKTNNASFLELAKSKLETFQQEAKGDLEARQKAVEELLKPLNESLEQVDGKLGELERARVAAYAGLDQQIKGWWKRISRACRARRRIW